MTADLAFAPGATNCGGCSAPADECYVLRDDCCSGCTHYPEPEPIAIDEAAVIRAVDGDVSVPLNPDEVTAAIHALARQGYNDDDIADRLGGGISGSSVYGYRVTGRTPRPRPAGGWTVSTPTTTDNAGGTDALLTRAVRNPSKRVQAAAHRAQDAVQRVRDLLAEEEGKREARERVERLERELREAKAALRGKPATAPAAPAVRAQTAPVEGGIACPNGCGKVSINAAGASAHARFCTVAKAS